MSNRIKDKLKLLYDRIKKVKHFEIYFMLKKRNYSNYNVVSDIQKKKLIKSTILTQIFLLQGNILTT